MEASQEPAIGWTEALGSEASNPPDPRTSGEKLFALGQWWTLSSCENRIKAQFEQWVRTNALRTIAEAEAELGPESANLMRSSYSGDRGAGLYNWDGRYVRNARGDVPGLCQLLHLLLRRCHPEITEDKAIAIFKDNARGCGFAIRWALGNSEAPAPNGQPGKTETQKPTKEPMTLDSH